jgi:hypothetical protein
MSEGEEVKQRRRRSGQEIHICIHRDHEPRAEIGRVYKVLLKIPLLDSPLGYCLLGVVKKLRQDHQSSALFSEDHRLFCSTSSFAPGNRCPIFSQHLEA